MRDMGNFSDWGAIESVILLTPIASQEMHRGEKLHFGEVAQAYTPDGEFFDALVRHRQSQYGPTIKEKEQNGRGRMRKNGGFLAQGGIFCLYNKNRRYLLVK